MLRLSKVSVTCVMPGSIYDSMTGVRGDGGGVMLLYKDWRRGEGEIWDDALTECQE